MPECWNFGPMLRETSMEEICNGLYLGNGKSWAHTYCWTQIGSHVWSFQKWGQQWPWVTFWGKLKVRHIPMACNSWTTADRHNVGRNKSSTSCIWLFLIFMKIIRFKHQHCENPWSCHWRANIRQGDRAVCHGPGPWTVEGDRRQILSHYRGEHSTQGSWARYKLSHPAWHE